MCASPLSILAPCYHLVADYPVRHVQHLYPFRTPAEFERELDWLLARYRPISLDQLIASKTEGAPAPRKPVFLSFDDGFREMAEVVGPLCRRKGVPATFFLTTDFLDNRKLGFRHKASLLLAALSQLPSAKALAIVQQAARARHLECREDFRAFILGLHYAQSPVLDDAAELAGLSYADYLKTERPYLAASQVQDLIRAGFSIGAHSLDHPRYSDLPLERQMAQTGESIEFLEKNFQMTRRAFAFPFVSDGVETAFYQQVFDARICEIIFCLGGMPSDGVWPLVERFGVERATNERLWTMVRQRSLHGWRTQFSRWLAPLRRLAR